jgi:hypothetical protein
MGIALCDVTRNDQLNEYYRENGLDAASVGDKIKHLAESTGVIAIRGACVGDENDMLASLEESVYRGHWRYLSAKKTVILRRRR